MNKEQRKLLKRVQRSGGINRDDLTDSEKETIYFLLKNKLIIQKATQNGSGLCYRISEEGKSELYVLHQTDFRFWFPIALSNLLAVAALIISIIALLK